MFIAHANADTLALACSSLIIIASLTRTPNVLIMVSLCCVRVCVCVEKRLQIDRLASDSCSQCVAVTRISIWMGVWPIWSSCASKSVFMHTIVFLFPIFRCCCWCCIRLSVACARVFIQEPFCFFFSSYRAPFSLFCTPLFRNESFYSNGEQWYQFKHSELCRI